MYFKNIVALTLFLSISSSSLPADEPLVGQPVQPDLKIIPVDAKEPFAKSFDFQRAVSFLDQASMAWTKQRKCFTCHTNFAHLIATSGLDKQPEYFAAVKSELDNLVNVRWKKNGPRWDAEIVMAATTLSIIEKRDQSLSENSKTAWRKVWEVQRQDGGFDWLKCDWPPMESDDEYGIAMAAVGISATPKSFRDQKENRRGITQLKSFINKQGLKRLHHRGLLIWAESLGGKESEDWIAEDDAKMCIDELLELQQKDGGWNSASLGKWNREDGKEPDFQTSDGYGTGFALFVLKKYGIENEHESINRGISWLKANQRKSGRWYTRSLSRDNKHFLTHAGTAMAIQALNACNIDR